MTDNYLDNPKFENKWRHEDLKPWWPEWNATPKYDEEGNLIYMSAAPASKKERNRRLRKARWAGQFWIWFDRFVTWILK